MALSPDLHAFFEARLSAMPAILAPRPQPSYIPPRRAVCLDQQVGRFRSSKQGKIILCPEQRLDLRRLPCPELRTITE